jgi:hypothetical protein
MAEKRVSSVMVLRAAAVALVALVALPAGPASAEQTAPQKLFRKRLLNDRAVSSEIKQVLRNGGFVDRDIRFGDLTGDGKSDAVVMVNQGGSAGRIALYVYSSHRARGGDGGGGTELRIRYKNQHLYRARATVKAMSGERPHGAVIYRTPIYDLGDELNDPAAIRVTEVRWRPKRRRFGVASTETVDRVRSRYCSKTGDFCTETIKSRRGVIYLELRSISFEGRYTLCVTPPGGGAADCRFFTLRRRGDRFVSQVRWTANFPDGGTGRYAVRWKLGAQTLGPALGFRKA